MITISEKAKQRAIEILQQSGKDNSYFIRVSVTGAGCNGPNYKIAFDNTLVKGDQVFEDKELKIVTDLKSFLYLCGTQLDISDKVNDKGFYFINPNTTRTKSCEEHFTT